MPRARGGAAIAISAVQVVSLFAPAGAEEPVSQQPEGTVVLLEDAAWSWFEDERVRFAADGQRLYLSGVEGLGSAVPGTVALMEVDLQTGARQHVDLGRGEPDDHNSAAIWEADDGEVTTAWARHHRDHAILTQRRRTDGSWLRLPPVEALGRTTYSNLHAAADAEGAPVLYDFYRGERYDPSVLASPDVGRTWTDLGRLLRDPEDSSTARPYVQYRSSGGRIDFIATEAHPRNALTSVYHGYLQDGVVRRSDGTPLGPVGSAIPVTGLTRVWAPSADERGWTADLVHDPATGHPVVAFSIRHSTADHRFGYGRWDGLTWTVEEIGFAGRALYSAEADYTGLIAIDPWDPSRVVASTDVDPVTGEPLVSASDGQQHWELWEGLRSPEGTWAWSALTAGSTVDNLRPVIAVGPGLARALVWMRGAYGSYTSYDVDLVGVVHDPDGQQVPSGEVTRSAPLDVLAPGPAIAEPAIPIPGELDRHPVTDVLLYRPGSGVEQLLLGDDQRHPTPIASPTVLGTYIPVPGDYDSDGDTDIYWYAPGRATDHLWTTSGTSSFTSRVPRQVLGTYTPIPGDYDGDDRTDIYWYAPGRATDHLWTATPDGTFTTSLPRQVTGTYTPIPGDHDGDDRTDILWYAPGLATDYLWWSVDGPLQQTRAAAVSL